MKTTSLPPSSPPVQARVAGLERLAELALAGDGFLWLEGVDENAAGLGDGALADCGLRLDPSALALSFCVNGITFTAVEDPDDGYRSAMAELFERDGNHCKNRFLPVPLTLRFDTGVGASAERDALLEAGSMADYASLFYPGVMGDILSVGTADAGDYYPSFMSEFSPELLTQAFVLFEASEIKSASEPLDREPGSGHNPARRI